MVLLVAATTSLFESGPESGAYDAGFEFGFGQATVLDQTDARGVEGGLRRAPSQTEVQAVRLVALYAVTLDRPADDEDTANYNAGYEEGRADARSGQPHRFEEAPTN